MDFEGKLAMARAIIRMRAPYLMSTIYGFIPHPVEGLNTMGVTKGMVLILDPKWLTNIPDDEVAAALVHESHHVLRDHIKRGEGCDDKSLANVAMDLGINSDIRSAGWKLPHGVFPEDYGFPTGLTFEEYYNLLKKKQTDDKQGQAQQKASKSDQNKDKRSEKGDSQQTAQDSEEAQTHSPSQPQQQNTDNHPSQQNSHSHGVGAGKCGGIAANPLSSLEQEVDAQQGRSEIDRKRITKQTVEEIKAHAERYGRGSIPMGLLGEIQLDAQKGEVRWQDELAHVIKRATGRLESGGMDFSLSRPSKRSYARGFPRPGLVQYLPEVAFILDTSGSMGDQQIIASIRETVGLFKTLGIDQAWFLQADAEVAQNAKRVRIRDLLGKVKIHGRGGTQFDPALRALEGLKPKPEIAVYLTDGDGYVSHRPKDIEVIWCVVRSYYNQKPPCDWGHAVIIANKTAY